jgi:hypothetical protein
MHQEAERLEEHAKTWAQMSDSHPWAWILNKANACCFSLQQSKNRRQSLSKTDNNKQCFTNFTEWERNCSV